MGTKSVANLVLEAIQDAGKPIRFQKIKEYVYEHYAYTANPDTIRQVLYRTAKEGILLRIKFKGISSFYSKPEWVVEGKIIPELNFDPYFNK
jgi:hypothetical protein